MEEQRRVHVRQTTTPFEQFVAIFMGFFTCGPIGALASWSALNGLQGKWGPWFLLGIPSAIMINILNIGLLYYYNGKNMPEIPSLSPSNAGDALETAQPQESQAGIGINAAPVAMIQSPPGQKDNCWFRQGSQEYSPSQCKVSNRKNYNGHLVWDIVTEQGTALTYVFWNDGTAEVLWTEAKDDNSKEARKANATYTQTDDWAEVTSGEWSSKIRLNPTT